MSGPAVAVLVPAKLTESQIRSVQDYAVSMADSVEGASLWISGRPFIISLGPESADELLEYEGLSAIGALVPRDIVGVCAMCNDVEDHKVLGSLAVAIARIVDGSIAFGSALCHYTSDEGLMGHSGHTEFNGESIMSIELFQKWQEHHDFRMVK